MISKTLFKISALLLMFLIGAVVADCDGKDVSWSDLGDDTTVETALKEVCSKMARDVEIGSMIDGCANIGNNHIDATIDIAQAPVNGTSDVTLVKEVCLELLYQVMNDCPEKGGSIWADASLGSDGHEYDYVHGRIGAYPKKNKCLL